MWLQLLSSVIATAGLVWLQLLYNYVQKFVKQTMIATAVWYNCNCKSGVIATYVRRLSRSRRSVEGAGARTCGMDEDGNGSERTTATARARSPEKRMDWAVRGGPGKWKRRSRAQGSEKAQYRFRCVGSAVDRLGRTMCTWARRLRLGAFSILNAPRCNI